LANSNNYIERLKQGDEKCLEEIYALYRRDFADWAIRKFNLDMEEARDIFQVTLISFYENVHNGKLNSLNSSLRTYLFAIGKYQILRSKKKSVMYANLDDLPDINLLETDNKDLELEAEQQSKVQMALNQLGGNCQQLLEMFYFREMNMMQIAEALEYKNTNVAKVKKANCMRKLAGIFKSNPGYEIGSDSNI